MSARIPDVVVVLACLCSLAACRATETSGPQELGPGGVPEKEILTQVADESYRDELVRIAQEENKYRDDMEELGATEGMQQAAATSRFAQQRETARKRWLEQRRNIHDKFSYGNTRKPR